MSVSNTVVPVGRSDAHSPKGKNTLVICKICQASAEMGTMTQHLASSVIAMDMFQAFVTVEEKENPVLRISPVQPSTKSDDRRRRGQGRRSNFPNRLTTARLRLPRQPATANGATTTGFLGPFPLHSGVFGPPPLFVPTQSTLV